MFLHPALLSMPPCSFVERADLGTVVASPAALVAHGLQAAPPLPWLRVRGRL
jgi:hypothetical protein